MKSRKIDWIEPSISFFFYGKHFLDHIPVHFITFLFACGYGQSSRHRFLRISLSPIQTENILSCFINLYKGKKMTFYLHIFIYLSFSSHPQNKLKFSNIKLSETLLKSKKISWIASIFFFFYRKHFLDHIPVHFTSFLFSCGYGQSNRHRFLCISLSPLQTENILSCFINLNKEKKIDILFNFIYLLFIFSPLSAENVVWQSKLSQFECNVRENTKYYAWNNMLYDLIFKKRLQWKYWPFYKCADSI